MRPEPPPQGEVAGPTALGRGGIRGFYAIVDVKGDDRDPGATETAISRRAAELLEGGPCFLQLRAKRLGAARLVALSRVVLPLCRAAGVPFCVNDRLDVALAVGADAVHVGQDDLPLSDVRAVLARLGRDLLVGVSTHDLEQARAAVVGGAAFIGFGPVFPTGTKERPDPVVGLEVLAAVSRSVAVPVVAIGGITRERLPGVVAAGAAAAAVISDIETASNRAAAARRVSAAFTGHDHV